MVSVETVLFAILSALAALRGSIDANAYAISMYAVTVVAGLLLAVCVLRRIGILREKAAEAFLVAAAIIAAVIFALMRTNILNSEMADSSVALLSAAPNLLCLIIVVADYISDNEYWHRRTAVQMAIVSVPFLVAIFVLPLFESVCVIPVCIAMSVLIYSIIDTDDKAVLDVTGVYGSEYISKRISAILFKTDGGNKVFVAMCQVGGNKEVIDEYGHKEGNRVFQAFADCLKDATVGTGMIVGRYWASKYVIIYVADDPKELVDVCMDVKDRCFHIADGHPYELRPCCAIGVVNKYDGNLDSLMADIEKKYLYDYLHVD